MQYENRIEPEKCKGMDDIRREIDDMDREIIAILGKRFQYVKAASSYKKNESSVRAPERQRAMLEQRRHWAASEGLSPDVIEKMYRDLVHYFIEEEMAQWQTDSTASQPTR
ncbi:isochorismate lyase [Reinekea sp. G2M2-21]|uniref:isochorismate lyase n=1 Tax=Reinekea sp. G2M2-21 TaxID=2788942 RepID=UPI0018AC2CBA|nr:isochorismate lyase [Reinekea sp. G2M2-21]